MADFSKPSNSGDASKGVQLLWNDPPMNGILQYYPPKDTTIIVSNGIRVLFRESNLYINGQKCTKGASNSMRDSGALLNFEACVFHSPFLNPLPHGILHRADLVWLGEKPSLEVIAQNVGKMDLEVLSDPAQTYVGLVEKFYFPDMAILKIKRNQVNSIVCLTMEAFVTRPVRTTLGNRQCILDYCNLRDYVEFKVTANKACPLVVCASDAKVITKKDYRSTPNTSKHFQNKLKRSGGNQSGGYQSGGNRFRGNRACGNRFRGIRAGGNRDGGNRAGGNRAGGNRDGGNRFVGHPY